MTATAVTPESARRGSTFAYDAFISYSHAVDGRLAPSMQSALQRFATPWYRLRGLRVFRDETSLSATPALWPSIEDALRRSRFLVFLASPAAAASPWVGKELEWWLEHRSADDIMIAVTDGRLPWELGGDRAAPLGVPPQLVDAMDHEPRWIDVRWARERADVSPRDPRFRAAIADLAAPMHNRPKDELVGEDIRQHRRALRLARGAGSLLAVLAVVAGIAAVVALHQRNQARVERDNARTQARIALSRALSAQASELARSQPDLAVLLGMEALNHDANAEARSAFVTAAQSAAVPDLQATLPAPGNSQEMAISSDGRTVAVGDAEGHITLFDPSGLRRLGPPLSGHKGIVTALTFSPDGRTLASGGEDTTVRLWDVAEHRALGKPLRGQSNWVLDLWFAAGGRTLLSSSEHMIRRWDVDNGRAIGGPIRFGDRLRTVVPLSDRDRVVVSLEGARGGVVDLRRQVWTGPRLPPGNLMDMALVPRDGLVAVAREDGTITLWDARRGRADGPVLRGPRSGAGSIAASADGRLLVAADFEQGRLDVWDVRRRRPAGEPMRLPGGPPSAVAFVPDDRSIVTLGGDGMVRIWALPRPRLLEGHRGTVTGVAVSADGRLAASSGQDGTVRLWDLPARRPSGPPLGAQGASDGVALSPDGRAVASIGWTAARLWTRSDIGFRGAPLPGRYPLGYSVAFSPDGRILATGHLGGILLWDVAGRRRLGPLLEVSAGAVSSLAFSPDGGTLASTDVSGAVRLWDVVRGALRGKPLRGSAGEVAFTPDGRLIATGDTDGRVTLWDVQRRQRLGGRLSGHAETVSGVAFSPDGRTLASISLDREVRLWDVSARRPIGVPVSGRGADVPFGPGGLDLAFTPDGRWLLHTASRSSVAMLESVWDEQNPELRTRLCRMAGRNMTAAEWRERVPGEPYRRTCDVVQ